MRSKLRRLLGRRGYARLFAGSIALAAVQVLGGAASGEPVYLAQPWFHRGPEVNLLTTSAGVRVAVDNEGHHLVDESINGRNSRARLALDSLQACGGEYYAAVQKDGYAASVSYAYFRISQGGKIQHTAVADVLKAGVSALPAFDACLDPDARHGMPGLLLFPKAGLAVLRGRSNQDSEVFSILPFSAEAPPVAFTNTDSVELAFEEHSSRGKRTGEMPAGVMADPNGQGFWYVAAQSGKIAVVHAAPGVKPDGGRSLNLAKIRPIGDAGAESFEAGVAANDALYLLLAHVNSTIGGVDAQRRLVRVGLADGQLTETSLTLSHYLKEAALALCGNRIVAYDSHNVKLFDSNTLKPAGALDAATLSENSPKDYRICRVAANPDGARLAVALATAYRCPDEPSAMVVLDATGAVQQRWRLKPGSIDDLAATRDGGWLLFSSDYTAKLGGSMPVRENEAVSIAQADQSPAVDDSRTIAAPAVAQPAPTKVTFGQGPLRERHKVWFGAPGGAFLPLGNGVLGAMMYGDADTARTILDVDSAWAGDETHQGAFQSLGEINFRLGHDPKGVTHFRRELDLRTGLFTVTYQYLGVTYRREAFCSYPRGLLALRFTADKPGAISGQLELTSRQKATFAKGKEAIEFAGQKSNDQKFACVMRVKTQGGEVLPAAGKDGVRDTSSQRGGKHTISSEDYQSVLLQGCDSVTLYVAGDTDYAMDPAKHFKGADPQQKIAPRLAHIGQMTFDQMKQESMADVTKLFDRCTLDLATGAPEAEALPVDKRRLSYRTRMTGSQATDVGFQALAFDAARYLMIACSRPGSLPANLQGHWNEGNSAEWTGDYHTDINIEMNYWFVEPANLAECAIPLFDYIESQRPYWRNKSKACFGDRVRGWTVDYMNNIFGAGTYMNFPPGSAWLSWHYAQHFAFGQDIDFLQTRAYPVLKELSEHWQDLLIKRPDGQLTTPKTQSPEHGPFEYGIAQDREMVCELFSSYLSAAGRLQRDAEFAKQVQELRAHVVPPKIGRWGQLQEWEGDEDSRYCTHRHMMQEFAVFPGQEINPLTTPELARAAIKTMVARGEGSTGWTKAWRASIYARLQQTNLAYQALSSVAGSFHDNLIWEGKSQIDAPCGYASGVCELLLQSQMQVAGDRVQGSGVSPASEFRIQNSEAYLLQLLPALPAAWPTGAVKGLRARGGYEVDMTWQDGQLTVATIHNIASPTDKCVLRYGGRTIELAIPAGESREFKGDANGKAI